MVNETLATITAPLAHALNVALPPRCLCCQEPMVPPGGLCPECWPNVQFLAEPLCLQCGTPLEQAQPEPCGHCLASHSALSQTRAAMLYDEGSRDKAASPAINARPTSAMRLP